MTTPLEQLVQRPGVADVTPDTLDAFLSRPGPALLVFTGDPAQRPEAQDVAVVAGQLAGQVRGLAVGVVGDAAEGLLKDRFSVSVVPTVVFLQNGRVKSTLARLQDWAVYARTADLVFGKRREVAS